MSLIQKKIKFNNNKKLILGDPGVVSRVDKMFVVKVYCKIEIVGYSRVDKMFMVKVYCKIEIVD